MTRGSVDRPLLPGLDWHRENRGEVGGTGGRYSWTSDGPLPEIGQHSLAKHDILARYVETYLGIVTSLPQRQELNFTIVDGFCGGGEYRLDQHTVLGSPLRLIEAVETATALIHQGGRPNFRMKVTFHFVDERREHIAHLRDLLVRRGYGPQLERTIHLHTSAFEMAYEPIVREIRSRGTAHRALFVLDQFGWKDVSLATVRRTLSEIGGAEVFLTFAVDALIDFLSTNVANVRSLLSLDLDRADVRELLDLKNERGWRWLIQNGLYTKVQERTGAPFYSPFFIHSPKAHRSYWFLHLSKHRQARQEIGELHWKLQNHFCHYGDAGFHGLGYDPSRDLEQSVMDYTFDDDAYQRSMDAVHKQIGPLIHPASRDGRPVSMLDLFLRNCNDSPVTLGIATRQILRLRDEGELVVTDAAGKVRPRAQKLDWTDRLVLPEAPSLFTSIGHQEPELAS